MSKPLSYYIILKLCSIRGNHTCCSVCSFWCLWVHLFFCRSEYTMYITQCLETFNRCCRTSRLFLANIAFYSVVRRRLYAHRLIFSIVNNLKSWTIWIDIRIVLSFMTMPVRRHRTIAIVTENSAQYNANPIAVKFELSQVNISLFLFIISRTPWWNFAFILTPH